MAESTTDQDTQVEDESAVVLDKAADAPRTGDEAAGGTESSTAGTPARKRGRRGKPGKSASAAVASTEAAATDSAATTAPKRGRRRKAEADASDRTATNGAPADGARAAGPGGARTLQRVISGLLVLAVLLAAVLLVQLIKGPGNGPKRQAQEDRSQDARQQANSLIPKLYSYDYRQINANVDQQLQLTTGTINDQIRSQTGPALKQLAPKVKAIVQAVALDSAVIDDSKPDIQVLVYLNQAVNSSLLPAPRLDRNRVVATMRLVDGQWKVADIRAL